MRVRLGMIFIAAASAAAACSASPTPPARRPIILITADTLRADHVASAIAPTLGALAREAVVFDEAITVAPLTLPAHASLMTARIPPAHGIRDNHIFALPQGTPTYATWLKALGYETAAFVSAVVLDRRYGLGAGFDVYDDEMPGDAPERAARETLARASDWLKRRTSERGATPFFLWIHLFEPHAPYRTGSYAGEVADVDRELGAFFGSVRAHALWDTTVLSVTSDHGESLGEHGEDTHGFFVYDSTIRIPWILKAPGLAPRRFAHQVRLLDVMPTMIALAAPAGADAVPLANAEGVDVSSDVIRDSDPGLEAYSETFLPRHQFNWSELMAIRIAGFKYIEAPSPELYRRREDPGETRNLVASEAAIAARLGGIVARANATPAAARRRDTTDAVEMEKFMSLGYIGHMDAAAEVTGVSRPDPKDKVDIYRLVMSALTLSESGRAADALEALGRAERLERDVTQVHYLRGVILGGQERYAEAAAALERTVELSPRHVLARFKLALAYLRLGQANRAESVLRAVLADEPRNVRAYQNLAAIAYTRGDLGGAEKMARQAVEIDRQYFEAWNTLGAVYMLAGRPGDAVDALTTAVRLNPANGRAQYNLSLALRRRGDPAAADAARQKACALDRQFCS